MVSTSCTAVKVGIGNNIRRLRHEKNLSVEKLGLIVGVSGATISNYENENRGYTQKTLEKIAEALGVSVAELFDREETEVDRVLSESDRQILSWFDGYLDATDLNESDKQDILDILKIADKILEKRKANHDQNSKTPSPQRRGR